MRRPSDSEVAVNYLEDGSLLFVALMDDGERMAELTITPSRTGYLLDIWGEKRRHGLINTLYKESRGMKNNLPYELRSWLRDVLSWEEPNNEWHRQEEFQIEGRSFQIRFNVRSGAIKFAFSELTVVSDRLSLDESFPELHFMMNGKVESLLHSLVVDSSECLDPQIANDQMPTTVMFSEVHKNFFGGWKVFTAYNSDNDVVMLQMGARTVDSHICLIEEDLPEWRYIAKGKFRQRVTEILSKKGVDLDD